MRCSSANAQRWATSRNFRPTPPRWDDSHSVVIPAKSIARCRPRNFCPPNSAYYDSLVARKLPVQRVVSISGWIEAPPRGRLGTAPVGRVQTAERACRCDSDETFGPISRRARPLSENLQSIARCTQPSKTRSERRTDRYDKIKGITIASGLDAAGLRTSIGSSTRRIFIPASERGFSFRLFRRSWMSPTKPTGRTPIVPICSRRKLRRRRAQVGAAIKRQMCSLMTGPGAIAWAEDGQQRRRYGTILTFALGSDLTMIFQAKDRTAGMQRNNDDANCSRQASSIEQARNGQRKGKKLGRGVALQRPSFAPTRATSSYVIALGDAVMIVSNSRAPFGRGWRLAS